MTKPLIDGRIAQEFYLGLGDDNFRAIRDLTRAMNFSKAGNRDQAETIILEVMERLGKDNELLRDLREGDLESAFQKLETLKAKLKQLPAGKRK